MNLPINNRPLFTSSVTLSSTQTIQQKMASSSHTINASTSTKKPSENIQMSPEEKIKIDTFIRQLEQKNSDKDFFSYVFNTMIHLKKQEKESFIAGTLQALKLRADETPPSSLYERFNKTLKRYMSISLMSSPLSTQLNRNIGQIKLESDDDDTDIDYI
ncbi:hypothetical protein [Providencia sp.]|uniref:hypothetical protein n=1 Tax=Providencia sp. TaxID=589 RepID=UPI00333FA4D8